ncbi:hypothetical protein HK103_006460 [Boothiomyces macroporosus]|uniref:Uncharacterized protein n=1 Tax=Boothiomyces macroporosus TaxID=261099 RepID=A0AAD5Y6B2_9FUNG|nr:hypothetical protein HK103_006460 [Boothiomyces macroporosus]
MVVVAYYYVTKFRKKNLEEKEANEPLGKPPTVVAIDGAVLEQLSNAKAEQTRELHQDEIQAVKPVDPNKYVETVVRNFKQSQEKDSPNIIASNSISLKAGKLDAINNILDGYEAASTVTGTETEASRADDFTVHSEQENTAAPKHSSDTLNCADGDAIKNSTETIRKAEQEKTLTRKAALKESGYVLDDAGKASREAINALITALGPPIVPPGRDSTDIPAPKDSIRRMTSNSDMSTTSSQDNPKSRIKRYSINQFDSKKPLLTYTDPKKKIDLSPSIKEDDEESILSYIPHMDGYKPSPPAPSGSNFMNTLTRKLSTDGPSLSFDEMLEEIIETEKAISIKSKGSVHE